MHNELVHHFLNTHPQECAREIENFSLDDILFFIKQLSKKEATSIISCLMPSIAAVCFQNLDIETSKGIIKNLPLHTLKKILPRIHEELRITLTESLPKNQKISLQHALTFSANTAGAFMNTHVLFLPIEHDVEHALLFIKQFSEEITPWIFCIDNQNELQGMITLKDILIAYPSQSINDIMQTCPMILLADTNIQSIAVDEVWAKQSVLPVTDENNVLLGVLEYNKIVTEIQQLLLNDRKENLADSLAHIMFMFSHATEDILTQMSQLTSAHQKEES
jgi:magnesium transporter